MELLLIIKEKDIFKDCKEQSNIDYKLRIAPRAVLFDNDNKVALLHVAKYDYYKLPGGGKEPSEDLIEALKRECYEECGCNIEVTGEIGQILEYRDRIALKHETYGFLAKVVGEKNEPLFVQDERNSNYKLLWLDLDKAIELVANSKPLGKTDLVDNDSAYFGCFIIKREYKYLTKAKELLNENS